MPVRNQTVPRRTDCYGNEIVIPMQALKFGPERIASMRRKHIAFCVDQAYGHIKPSLGIAAELARRGHLVSYSVPTAFVELVESTGARAVVYEPLMYRSELYPSALQQDGSYDLSRFATRAEAMTKRKTESSLRQLRILYGDNRPDIVLHDDAFDLSARCLADEWGIPRIRFMPAFVSPAYAAEAFQSDTLVLITAPQFLHEASKSIDERFKFVGFVREEAQGTEWPNRWWPTKVLLVSPTTGLLPQVEFCRRTIQAFQNTPWRVVLSAVGRHDPISRIDPQAMANMPDNFTLNADFPNVAILEHACLYIGQGGPRSAMEALYAGVPSLLIPPSIAHEYVAYRIDGLGLGKRLTFSDASPEAMRAWAEFLIEDKATMGRVREAQKRLREQNGAEIAADLIEQRLH